VEQLEREAPAGRQVTHLVDGSHPAAAERGEDLVLAAAEGALHRVMIA
jgi:hypothetical protein